MHEGSLSQNIYSFVLAGLATASAVSPYELFTDIIDGIDDVEIEDIADQL